MTGLEHYPMGMNAFQMVPPRATPDTATAPKKRGPKSKVKTVREMMQAAATRVNQEQFFCASNRTNSATASR